MEAGLDEKKPDTVASGDGRKRDLIPAESNTSLDVGQEGPTLATLAERINQEHRACEKAMNVGLQHALECGRLLIEAKSQANHGGWLPWVAENCEFSERTAQNYSKLAAEFPKLRGKTQRVADLSYREAVKLLAAPKEEAPPEEGADPELPLGFVPQADQALIGGRPPFSVQIGESAKHPGYWNCQLIDWRPQNQKDVASILGYKRPIAVEYLAEALVTLLEQEHLSVDDFEWKVVKGKAMVRKVRNSLDEEAGILWHASNFWWLDRIGEA